MQLELYLAYADQMVLMDLLENLLCSLTKSLFGGDELVYQKQKLKLDGPFRRITVEEAVVEYNPELDAGCLREIDYLREACKRLDIPVREDAGPGKLLIDIFEKTVESRLDKPTYVTAYPAEVSPLARRSSDDPWLVDRFELFIAGRELANGFAELNDPEDQDERFRTQAEQKAAGNDEAMPYDTDYIRALEYGLPPTAGLGVGIDRLVMLMTDSPSIRDVLLFPHLRPQRRG